MLGKKQAYSKNKTPVGLTLLKRPTNPKQKLALIDDDTSQKPDDEATLKLEKFLKDGEITVFETALKLWLVASFFNIPL